MCVDETKVERNQNMWASFASIRRTIGNEWEGARSGTAETKKGVERRRRRLRTGNAAAVAPTRSRGWSIATFLNLVTGKSSLLVTGKTRLKSRSQKRAPRTGTGSKSVVLFLVIHSSQVMQRKGGREEGGTNRGRGRLVFAISPFLFLLWSFLSLRVLANVLLCYI